MLSIMASPYSPSEEDNAMDWEEDVPPTQSIGGYAVVDTNIVLDHCYWIKASCGVIWGPGSEFLPQNTGMIVLAIPWVVICELDKLKTDKSGSRPEIAAKARRANRILFEMLSRRDGSIIGQKRGEWTEVGKDSHSTNDDKILSYCIYLTTKRSKVALLSNDNNLLIKSSVNGITSLNWETIVRASGERIMTETERIASEYEKRYPRNSGNHHNLSLPPPANPAQWGQGPSQAPQKTVPMSIERPRVERPKPMSIVKEPKHQAKPKNKKAAAEPSAHHISATKKENTAHDLKVSVVESLCPQSSAGGNDKSESSMQLQVRQPMPVQKVCKPSGAVIVQPSKELEYVGHGKGHTKKFTKEITKAVKNKKGRRTTVITHVREVKQVVTTTALEDSFSSDDEEYNGVSESEDEEEEEDDDDDEEEEEEEEGKSTKTHRKPKSAAATVKLEKENYARQLAELIKTFVRGVSDVIVSELNSGCLRGVNLLLNVHKFSLADFFFVCVCVCHYRNGKRLLGQSHHGTSNN